MRAWEEMGDISKYPFIREYKPLFAKMYKQMIVNAPCIVTIPRKGPRLFDLFEDVCMVSPPIITPKALDFSSLEKLKSRCVPVFDDIIIYGSTMQDAVDALINKGITPIPYSLVFDIDNSKFRGVKSGIRLPHKMIVNFSCQIANSFSLLGIPYDIDHPLLFLNNVSYEEVFAIKEKVNAIDISSILQKKYGISNMVFHYNPPFTLDTFFNVDNCDFSSTLSKIRIFYNKKNTRLCIVPILLFEFRIKDINKPVFGNEILNNITERALSIFEENNLPTPEREEAIYRLSVYLIEYVYGLSFLYQYSKILNKDLSSTFILRPKDVILIFGETFGEFIIRKLENSSNQIIKSILKPAITITTPPMNKNLVKIENKELFKEIFKTDEYKDIRDHLVWDSEINCIWNVCRLLRKKDIITRDPEKIISDRLKFGFTFRDLLLIARQKCESISPKLLSISIDYLIDKGVVVPLFMKYPTGYWVRAFRFGESLYNSPESLRAHYLKDTLPCFFENIKKDTISQFDFEKLYSYLHHHLKNNIHYEGLRMKVSFDEFGARPFVEAFIRMEGGSPVGSKPFLQESLQRNYLIEEGNGYKLNEAALRTIYSDDSPLGSLTGDANLYVVFFADLLFSEDKPHERKDKIALLLSTCNNPTNFLNAYKVGIYAWFQHREVQFSRLLNEILLLLAKEQRNPKYWTEIDGLLEDLATRLKQCETKRRVWNSASELIKKIDDWSKKNMYRERLWNKIKNISIDIRKFDDKEQIQYDYLYMLYLICRSMTNILRSALTHYIGVGTKKYKSLEDYIKEHNKLINYYKYVVSLDEIREISITTVSFENFNNILKTLKSNYEKLYGKFEEIKAFDEQPPKFKEFEQDMAIVGYDLKGFSDMSPSERDRIEAVIDKHMKTYLKSIGEEKYYKTVLNDENMWPVSTVEKALRAAQKLLEILKSEHKYARIAIHFTSPNDRIKIYEQEKVLGGDCFIVCARLREIAEDIQKNRGETSNVILLTKDAYLNLSNDLRDKLFPTGPLKKPVQGKSVREIEYYEIDEKKIRDCFSPPKLEEFFNV